MAAADRRERERSQRRESILTAADRLFAERPYDSVRVDDIAEAAELAKGTVYLYFSEKDTIVSELGRRLLDRVEADMKSVTGRVRSGLVGAADGLLRVVGIWNDAYWAQPGLFRILVLDRPRLLAEFSAGVDGHGPHVLEPIETLVEAGQASGEFSASANPSVVSHALWALFVGGLLLSGRGEISETDLRATSLPVLRALVSGLCLPAGAAAERAGRAHSGIHTGGGQGSCK